AELGAGDRLVQPGDRLGELARVGDLDLLALVDEVEREAPRQRVLEARIRGRDLAGEARLEELVDAQVAEGLGRVELATELGHVEGSDHAHEASLRAWSCYQAEPAPLPEPRRALTRAAVPRPSRIVTLAVARGDDQARAVMPSRPHGAIAVPRTGDGRSMS